MRLLELTFKYKGYDTYTGRYCVCVTKPGWKTCAKFYPDFRLREVKHIIDRQVYGYSLGVAPEVLKLVKYKNTYGYTTTFIPKISAAQWDAAYDFFDSFNDTIINQQLQDFCCENVGVLNGKFYLLDWEYSS